MSIKVNNLTKIYDQQKAVNNVSFLANEGEILGLLGPNGAGKTTTMKMLTCFMPPSSGGATICGLDISKDQLEIRQNIGYLPEHNPLYPNMYIKEYLTFVSEIHNISNPKERIAEVIEEVGLVIEQNKKISQLSKGYKQRVGLAQAIIHNPKVLILDEPISGLDPNQLLEIRNLISGLKKDKTIIFSSHILQEVESICDRVIILDQGNLVKNENMQTISESVKMAQEVFVEFLNDLSLEILNNGLPSANIKMTNNRTYNISYKGDLDLRESIFDLAVKRNNKILELKSMGTSLENVFKNATKKS